MRIYARNKVIWVDFSKDGKRYRKSTKLPDTKANRKRVALELAPLIESATLEPVKNVRYYFKAMLKCKKLKHSTLRKYESCYNAHISVFGERDISSFKVSEIKSWVASIEASPKQIKSIVSVFSMCFQEAIDDEAIKDNPFKHVKLPKLVQPDISPFSKEEVEILIASADGWFKNLLAVLFMTGMRIGEAIALEWSDIDEFICVNKTLGEGIVDATKTYNARHIPIFDDLKPYIQNQRYKTGLSRRVFVNLNDAKDLHSQWSKLLFKCNIERRVLYQARHTFAIHALDSGMFKVSQIAKILGHSSVQMLFQKYAKFIKSEVEEIPTNFSTIGTNFGTKVG